MRWMPIALLVLGLSACHDEPAAGVTVHFALDETEDFYAHPWPSDLRLDAEGHPQIDGMPRADNADLVEPLVKLVSGRRGWNLLPVAYFQFDGAPAPAAEDDGPLDVDAAYFVDVDASSPERGRRIPVVAHRLEVDVWTPPNLLAITPAPGQLLRPATRYAAVIAPGFGDADGEALESPEVFGEMAAGVAPAGSLGRAATELFAPLWEEIARDQVAAATVLTTADTVSEIAARMEGVAAEHDAELVSLALDPEDGVEHERFCELHAVLRIPQFQRGEPPFDEGGDFVLDAEGRPEVQRYDEMPVALAVPRTLMPAAGYPFVTYVHGTDGTSNQVIDRGPITSPDGEPAVGLGPAHVLAAHGVAAVGPGVLLGPERLARPQERAYLRIGNLAAFPYNFEQANLDLRLMHDWLDELEIPPETLAACAGAELPEGASTFRFDVSQLLVMGQSSGSHLAAMLGALDARTRAIVPTGVGGYWSQLLSVGSQVAGSPELFALLIDTEVRLTPLHPATNLLELAWEAGEPLVYAQRVARQPLPEHAPRHIYMPAAQGDSYHAEPLYDAMAVAYGLELAGEQLWPEMGAALDSAGLTERATLPATGNVDDVTSVVQQWAGDGIADPHMIFQQLPEVKHQYGCFFATLLAEGVPTVPTPAQPGSGCGE